MSLNQKEIALFFNVVVWGEEFRGYLTQLLLPSLLAPKNIPGLKNRKKSKFIFVAPIDDWEKIKLSHSFKLLSDLIDIVYFEIPTPTESDNKHLVMSEGHKLASQFTFDAKAQGVFVTPDLMLSDGAVTALEQRAEQGFQAVLCFAIRFGLEGCLRDVGERFDLPAEVPISIKPRDLAKIALDNLHIESKRYIFDTDYFADAPWSLILTKRNLQGILLHTFSWCPLLLDYSSIQRHDVSVFEHWTLDGDYVFRNFGAEAKVHVVQDSDEIMLASFTPEDDLPNVAFDPYMPHWQKYLLIPFLGHWLKVLLIRLVRNSDQIDPLKERLWELPVRVHHSGISPEWKPLERLSSRLIRKSCKLPSNKEKFLKSNLIVQYNLSAMTKTLHEIIVRKLGLSGFINRHVTRSLVFVFLWAMMLFLDTLGALGLYLKKLRNKPR